MSEKSIASSAAAKTNQIIRGVSVRFSDRVKGYTSAANASPEYKPVQREQTPNL